MFVLSAVWIVFGFINIFLINKITKKHFIRGLLFTVVMLEAFVRPWIDMDKDTIIMVNALVNTIYLPILFIIYKKKKS